MAGTNSRSSAGTRRRSTFDDAGSGPPHWWSDEDRQALLAAIAGYNVIGIFHGHEHETPMIYRVGDLDLFKPKASFMGGFARGARHATFMDVALAEAHPPHGDVVFTNAFSKAIAVKPPR